MKRIRLSSGLELKPDPDARTVWVSTEAEAAELEAEGWQRKASKATLDSDTLRKVFHLEAQRSGIVATLPSMIKTPDSVLRRRAADAALRHAGHDVAPLARWEFGEVNAGKHGRLIVSHEIDGAEETLAVHGINTDVDNLDADLRGALHMASADFGAAEDVEEQTSARILIGAVVASILDRHEWLAAQVRRQQHRQRYA